MNSVGVLQSKTPNKLTHWTVGQVSSSLLTKHVNRHSSLRAGVQLKQQQLLFLSLKVASTEQSGCSGDINIFEDLPNTVTANTYLPAAASPNVGSFECGNCKTISEQM